MFMPQPLPKRWALGVDLAHKSFDAALAPEGCDPKDWKSFSRRHFPLRPDSPEGAGALIRWVDEQTTGGTVGWSVVESTGRLSERFAQGLRALAPLWPETVIANPAWIRSLAVSLGVRHKTDRIDGAMIALFGAVASPAPRPPRPERQQLLRDLARTRARFVEDVTRWQNRLREERFEAVREAVRRTVAQLREAVTELERRIEAVIADDPALAAQQRLLPQIKGIGKVIAFTLTAELGDLTLYGRAQLPGAVGMYPVACQTAGRDARPARLAKGGGHEVRRVLYGGAMSLFKSKGVWRDWIDRQEAKGKNRMEIITALMRKLLLVARAVMINGGIYDETKIGA